MVPDQIQNLLDELEQEAYKYANISKETAVFLYTMIKIVKPKNILEIGTSNGYSTLWFALGNPESKIITIEKSPERTNKALNNFKRADITNIELRQGNALDIIPSLQQQFDFIFIDAAKPEYKEFYNLIKNKRAKESIVAFDNAISHETKLDSLKEQLQEDKENYTIIHIGKGLLILGKQ